MPCSISALSGYVECCRKLLQTHVDLDARDDSGRTCLHLCAYKGNVECLDLLISSCADFRLTDRSFNFQSFFFFNKVLTTSLEFNSSHI